MSERLYLYPCPVCASSLSITLDTMSEDIKIRPENLAPLVKDKLTIVNNYKRIKGLGSDWEKKHGDRGIVYADNLLICVGYAGGQVDRAIALMEWLQSNRKEWSLDSASRYFPQYTESIRLKKELTNRRCIVCSVSFQGNGDLCKNHDWACAKCLYEATECICPKEN